MQNEIESDDGYYLRAYAVCDRVEAAELRLQEMLAERANIIASNLPRREELEVIRKADSIFTGDKFKADKALTADIERLKELEPLIKRLKESIDRERSLLSDSIRQRYIKVSNTENEQIEARKRATFEKIRKTLEDLSSELDEAFTFSTDESDFTLKTDWKSIPTKVSGIFGPYVKYLESLGRGNGHMELEGLRGRLKILEDSGIQPIQEKPEPANVEA